MAPVHFYHASFSDPAEGWHLQGDTYQFHINDDTLDLTQDPDSDILDAQFFPLEEAITRLSQLAVAPLRDPVLSFLHGDSSKTEWHYEMNDVLEYVLKI